MGITSFESFEVRGSSGGCGAGTSSLRNPNYLLGKLRVPDALDDVRFLPLVSVSQGQESSLFYHYRQHSVCSNHSVLLYLPVERKERQPAFESLCVMERMLSENGDARVEERAEKLAKGILLPFLKRRFKEDKGRVSPIEVVDIGAGSGALAAAICGQLRESLSSHAMHQFGVKLVDILQPEFKYFWNGSRCNAVEYVVSFVEDFRSWCDNPPVSRERTRIALISQLFNNQSIFQIKEVEPAQVLKNMSKTLDLQRHSPTKCLRGGVGNLNHLLVSPVPVNISGGRTFCQISLEPYFRALKIVCGSAPLEKVGSGAFLPVRTFDTKCLFSANGKAILPMLLTHCCAVVVYDADLCPCHLQDAAVHSSDFVAVDMTRALRLRGNHCYVLAKKGEAGLDALKGEELW